MRLELYIYIYIYFPLEWLCSHRHLPSLYLSNTPKKEITSTRKKVSRALATTAVLITRRALPCLQHLFCFFLFFSFSAKTKKKQKQNQQPSDVSLCTLRVSVHSYESVYAPGLHKDTMPLG